MSNPSPRSNPTGGSSSDKQHRAPPPSTPHHSIHQSQSFSSYHPPPPPPPSGGGYYYHPSSPYPPHHQHQSPIPVQYSAHPPYSYHHPHPHQHHRHQQHLPHQQHQHHHGQPYHPSHDALSWPAPPQLTSASSVESPPYIENTHAFERMDMTSSSERSPDPSPSPQGSTITTVADASAASTLSKLANAASAHSPSPTSMSPNSSAGPLKKRRKMENAASAEGGADDDDPTASPPPNESPCSSPNNIKSCQTANADINVYSDSDPVNFPRLLHKLLSKGGEHKNEHDLTAISSSIEWLPHGKGWRVLRWDTLCTEVLPNEFPDLCEDSIPRKGVKIDEETKADDDRDDSSQGKKDQFSDEQWIEAFLQRTKAWGFKEVMHGRDRGSFRHELFVKESPEQCHEMRLGRVRSNSNSILSLTPTYSNLEIRNSDSNLDIAEHSASWRKSHKTVSSIFKPRRQHYQHYHHQNRHNSHHNHYNSHHNHYNSHLHVPALASSATASFAEGWGTDNVHHGHSQQHYPPPYPPPTRSPKTIRFRDETESTPFHHRDDAVEITPNPEVSSSPRQNGRDGKGFHRGFVSRRGRRPGLISRHSTH